MYLVDNYTQWIRRLLLFIKIGQMIISFDCYQILSACFLDNHARTWFLTDLAWRENLDKLTLIPKELKIEECLKFSSEIYVFWVKIVPFRDEACSEHVEFLIFLTLIHIPILPKTLQCAREKERKFSISIYLHQLFSNHLVSLSQIHLLFFR